MYESPGVSFLKELSDIHKIGQLIMPRIDFKDLDSVDSAEVLVKDYSVCGFIIFNGEFEKVRETTTFLQSISEFPLLFGIDAERGLGQMLEGATYFPFLMSQGAINDPEILKKQAKITANEMLYAGINLIFAPVIDVNSNPENPIINIRSFSDDPELVSKLGTVFIDEIQKNGVLACCKHFPGHGSTSEDSHSNLPIIEKTIEELADLDLVPFISAVENKVAAVMPAHISFPNLDDSGKPATLSKVVLENILRIKLGYNGLIISDSFRMDALDELGDEVSNTLEAINAGVNIVLDPEDPISLIEGLSEKISQFEDSINKSLNRIFYNKKFATVNSKEKPPLESNKEISEEISRRSICRLKGDIIKNNKVITYIFDNNNENDSYETIIKYIESSGVEITDKFYKTQVVDIPDDASLIFIFATTVSAWTDKYKLNQSIYDFISGYKNLENEKILLNFGSPYIVNQFDFFDTVILSFDSNENCQKSVADVLLGKLKPEGNLPVNL